MAAPSFASLSAEYTALWQAMQIKPEKLASLDQCVSKIAAASARYRSVAQAVGVPWGIIAIIHNLEGSGNFKTHMHNGDPLSARTVQVPSGRPVAGTPPFTWEESAADALTMHGLQAVPSWSPERVAYELERYNGWGYRKHHPEVKSPYLWSFTNHYTSGKYVADGTWSATAVSQQIGGMALLKHLADRGVFVLDAAAPAAFAALGAAGAPTRSIARDDADQAAVSAIQAALSASGFRVQVDGHFGEATENAVRLFQARSANAVGEPLVIDGVVGPETWRALTGTSSAVTPAAPSPLGQEAARIALGEEGVLEEPPGSNRGPRVDMYVSSVGANPAGGYAWCACFVHWCFAQAAKSLNAPNPVPASAGVLDMWSKTKAAGISVLTPAEARAAPERITRGSVFFISTGGGYGHMGIVLDVANGKLDTIEGNTTLIEGSREGLGVYRRNARSVQSINLGFALYA